LTLNIEESNENKTVSRFQVDLKHNRLRSTKPVVEVSKIDLGSLSRLDSLPGLFMLQLVISQKRS